MLLWMGEAETAGEAIRIVSRSAGGKSGGVQERITSRVIIIEQTFCVKSMWLHGLHWLLCLLFCQH